MKSDYVKMCDCEEIQRKRKDENGDHLYFKEYDAVMTVCGIDHCAMSFGYYDSLNSIWLPTQKQIQEMIGYEIKPGLMLCKFFAWYKYNRPSDIADELDSMEELWLAFYMYGKNKKWNGDKWISI